MKGSLFENLVLNEFIKFHFNRGENIQPFFWQENHGKEIDCIMENGTKISAVEIKSGKTMTSSYFDNLHYWRTLSGLSESKEYVVYGGDQSLQTKAGTLISWRDLDRIFTK